MSKRTFSNVVKGYIAKLKETATPYNYDNTNVAQIDICKIVKEQNFLPIFFDWTAFCAVRPNGEMVWYDYENPNNFQVEYNERIRNIAMVKGIERFPDLLPFLPKRSLEDIDCPYCETTAKTREAMPESPRESINCYCGGLAWIPKNGL